MTIPFYRQPTVDYGVLQPVAPGVRRIVARNPGPFSYTGTGTYVIGTGEVAVIDPGPDRPEHIEALLAGLAGERVTHQFITHTHIDHSPAARALAAASGAPTHGFGPHHGGIRPPDYQPVEEGGDWDLTPDVALRDGDVVAGAGWALRAVHTPGHTSNHLCFALEGEGILFTGDHVMGWSTSIITPPDGDMAAYMASLDKLLARADRLYLPTHGPAITDPAPFVRAFIAHRHAREAQITRCLEDGIGDIAAMVTHIYHDVPEALHSAAAHSVFAHLVHMVETGRARCAGPATLTARYEAPC